jgi:enamine deaminase RidA (YjgF/YER057c/UK114 family)
MAVTLSGLRATDPEDVEGQTREALSTVRTVVCDDLGGELMDVVHLRVFVRESALTPESRADVHRVRRQAFEWPYYPSSTVVGVASLVEDAALVELETEVFVPDDGWETDVLELRGDGPDAGDTAPDGV